MTRRQSQGKTTQVRNAEFDLAKDQIIRDYQARLRLCMVALLTRHALALANKDLEVADDAYAYLGEELILGRDSYRLRMRDISTQMSTISVVVILDFEYYGTAGEYTTTIVAENGLDLHFEGDLVEVKYPSSSDPQGEFEEG